MDHENVKFQPGKYYSPQNWDSWINVVDIIPEKKTAVLYGWKLVYDAMETEVELTEEQMNELWEYYYESDIGTETQREMTIPVSTYEAAMEIISQLEQYNDDELNEWFEIVKSWVKEVIDRTESEE